MTFAFAKNYESVAAAITAAEADQIGDDELVGVLVGKVTRGYTNKPGSSVVADGVFVVSYTGGRLIRFGSAQDILDQRHLVACKADAGANPKQYQYGSTILHTRFVDETDKYHLVTNGAHTEIDADRIQHAYMLDTSRNQMVVDLVGKLNGDSFPFPKPEAESTLAVSIMGGDNSVTIAAIRLMNAGGGYKQVLASDGLAKFRELGIETGYSSDSALSDVWPVVPAGKELEFKPVGSVPWAFAVVVLGADVPGTGNVSAQPELMPEAVVATDSVGRLVDDSSPLSDRTIESGAFGYQIEFVTGSGVSLSNVIGETFGAGDASVNRDISKVATKSDLVITIPANASVRIWESRP